MSRGDGYRNRLGSRWRVDCVSAVDRTQRMSASTQSAGGKRCRGGSQGRGSDRTATVLKRNRSGRYRRSRSWCDLCVESNCLSRDGCGRAGGKGNCGCLQRGCDGVDLHRHSSRGGRTIRTVSGIGRSDAMRPGGERRDRKRSRSICQGGRPERHRAIHQGDISYGCRPCCRSNRDVEGHALSDGDLGG